MKAPIAVALDVDNLQAALNYTKIVAPHVQMVKVGLQSYLRDGNTGVAKIKNQLGDTELFLDLKLHDIPQTVAGAIKSITKLKPNVITIHATGGIEMMKAAVSAAGAIQVAAVTILTSLSQQDVEVFSNLTIEELVPELAQQAVAAGCSAIVCSPLEVKIVRSVVPSYIKLIVPGVRLPEDEAGDQVRIATPRQTMTAGADILVMGRSILNSKDPINRINRIANSIASV